MTSSGCRERVNTQRSGGVPTSESRSTVGACTEHEVRERVDLEEHVTAAGAAEAAMAGGLGVEGPDLARAGCDLEGMALHEGDQGERTAADCRAVGAATEMGLERAPGELVADRLRIAAAAADRPEVLRHGLLPLASKRARADALGQPAPPMQHRPRYRRSGGASNRSVPSRSTAGTSAVSQRR